MRNSGKSLSALLFEGSKPTTTRRHTLSSLLFEAAGDAEAAAEVLKDMPDLDVGPGAMKKWLNGPGSDPKVRAFLAKGQADGNKVDEKVSVKSTAKTLGPLVPTQNEIELGKSVGYPLSSIEKLRKVVSGGTIVIGPADNNKIIVSDNIILDGHHRWSQALAAAGPDAKIAAYDIKISGSPSEKLAFSQISIAAAIPSGQVPDAKAGGKNILGKTGEQIKADILESVGTPVEDGKILSEDYITELCLEPELASKVGVDSSSCDAYVKAQDSNDKSKIEKELANVREKVASHFGKNLAMMNQPAEGSPPRVDMPQFDRATYPIPTQIDAIKTGKVNFKPRFVAKEGKTSDDNLVMERWLRLAGLTKG
jgi:hypothetical protein